MFFVLMWLRVWNKSMIEILGVSLLLRELTFIGGGFFTNEELAFCVQK